ncbi:cobalamin biosynthesis protein, partial [Thioclava sp. BHET1]
RLTALLFLLCAGHWRGTAGVILRDAPLHRSPNAGWPEAAMAGALGIRLSGPRIYGDRIAEEPWVNGSAPDPDGATLLRALALYRRALLLLALLAVLLASLSLI